MIRTKVSNLILATMAIFLGIILDASNAMGAQALHHLAFIGAGYLMALGTRRSR